MPITIKPKTIIKKTILNAKSGETSYLGSSIEQTYQDKQLRQHIFDSPDTYVGSIDPSTEAMWIIDTTHDRMKQENLTFVEAFLKIFDEILVNAIDHHARILDKLKKDPGLNLRPVRKIDVNINRSTGQISVLNDGDGIDIAMHKTKKVYVPQMLFGDLLTSGNYDKNEERVTGGKNGYGAALANIFSREFIIETVDSNRKLKYRQVFRDNMQIIEEPVIEPYKKAPFTKITWTPDFERFDISMEDLESNDNWKLLERRVYDASACTTRNLNVYLNGDRIKTKDFEEYMNLYIGRKSETKRVFIKAHERWEVGVCLSPDGKFRQISFVNGVFTDIGGRHVRHVVDNMTKRLAEMINEKSKKGSVEIKPTIVKDNIWVFIKCTIVNPNFDTQTKRKLTTLVSKFGSRCNLPEDFLKKVSKIGIEKRALELANFKEKRLQSKKTDGSKTRIIRDEDITDASYAGSKKSEKCTFVVTEGKSAASLMESGISALSDEEQKYWGWLPLRGKMMNAQKASISKVKDNKEIAKIKKALGLKDEKDYSKSIQDLRYGRIMILTDADKDGDHIKGLVMSMIYYYWPSLVNRVFLCSLSTPIVKVWPTKAKMVRGMPDPSKTIEFYSEKKYDEWSKAHRKGWEVKYYKGLATHNAKEARHIIRKMATTSYTRSDNDVELVNGNMMDSTEFHIKLAFSDTKIGDGRTFKSVRKEWVGQEDSLVVEPVYDAAEETFTDFVNRKLILFSKADNVRSIPSMVDGLKPSQRKILYGAFKKKLYKDMKVEQFQGYVSEHTCYHHGGVSICEAIIKMAQDFPGANNMSLMYPSGGFGTRSEKGKDAGAPRYIFTRLTELAKTCYNEYDQPLLDYQIDDGHSIEPKWYIPVIPMLLVNGAEGIGTGYSTTIPNYNPLDIIQCLRAKMNGEEITDLKPWYRGFGGKIIELEKSKYLILGRYQRIGKNKIRIYELPTGSKTCKSFNDYKKFLYGLMEEPSSKKKKKDSEKEDTATSKSRKLKDNVVTLVEPVKKTDNEFIIDITFKNGVLDDEFKHNETKPYSAERKLHIATSFTTTNMVAFDASGNIKTYNSTTDIINDFYPIRLHYYQLRKDYITRDLKHKLARANAKYRFVVEIMDDVINIYRKKKKIVVSILDGTAEPCQKPANPPYPKFATNADDDESKASYDYLTTMHISSFTDEKLASLKNEKDKLTDMLQDIESKNKFDLWNADLDALEAGYNNETDDWYHRQGIVQRKSVTIKKNMSCKKTTTFKKKTISFKKKT